MPIILKKLCLFGLISISLHICFACWNPVGLQGYDLVFDRAGMVFAMDAYAGDRNDFNTSPQPNLPTQSEIRELLFGVLLSIIGLTAIALSFLRWKTNDLSLISFGIFCFLYGMRTRALHFLFDIPQQLWEYPQLIITCLTPIPAWIFMEQFLGKGWKSSIRRLWQVQIVVSIAALIVASLLHSPGKAMIANNVMAIAGILVVLSNLFRPGLQMTRELRVLICGIVIFGLTALHANIAPWITGGFESPWITGGHESRNFEWLGLLIFICCLVYVVAYRFFQNEKNLFAITHELETARQIQSFILPQEMPLQQSLEITARYVPMATMAGDFYDFIRIDEKRLGILVADVSGHGVPASLIASMVKIAFVSQTPHASDPARVLTGVNRILCGKFESDFVTAGYLYIDTGQQTASYAAAGHPPLLLWRQAEQKISEFRTKGIILGQFEGAHYEAVALSYDRGDRFFLYTDGIVEATNMAGEIFGWERLKSSIATGSGHPSNKFVDKLIEDIYNWSAKGSSTTLDDDLTLVVVDAASAAK